MAPIKPQNQARRLSSFPTLETGFTSTKKDKRLMKHSLLMSKVRKSSDKSTGQRKRRRPSKRLVASLETLADVLPEITAATPTMPKSSRDKNDMVPTLKSKPGISKKKEKVIREEKERFSKNLAAITQAQRNSSVGTDDPNLTPNSGTDGRWAVLRRHLESTIGKT